MTDTSKGARTRERLVESMLELIQASGYAGTGLNTVTAHARAPKGSLYFHFPEGKRAMGEAAIALAASRFQTLIDRTEPGPATPREVLSRVVDVLCEILTRSDFRLGCPVSVVTLEMGADDDRLREACAKAFETWIASFAALLAAEGHPVDKARSLATAVVSMVEGATIVSRAQRDVGPLRAAETLLSTMLERTGP
ncbi:TetR/AcrR family transcriptional regulator [Glycomyces tenuis]|uniref:TetR/AcrR family transcriptional regulator n=1 Tax=Glycomyces tenuis TaxID=58116 RepID=UPI000550C8F0|nr:TetR/AcrR family transcriptional regulator [Glycomyces tenuis]